MTTKTLKEFEKKLLPVRDKLYKGFVNQKGFQEQLGELVFMFKDSYGLNENKSMELAETIIKDRINDMFLEMCKKEFKKVEKNKI